MTGKSGANGKAASPGASDAELRAALRDAFARRQCSGGNLTPSPDRAATDRPVVTNDRAMFFPPASLGGGGIEQGPTLIVEKVNGRSRVVGVQVPRSSRPRERRATGATDSAGSSRGGDSGGGSLGGDSGDRPRPSADDDEAEPPGVALPAGDVPAVVITIPLEGRLTARFVDGGPGDDERIMAWLASSGELIRVARFALDLHQLITDEADR